MSDENTAPEALEDGDEELVEIDWGVLQGAIDGMSEQGLDLDDRDAVLSHWAVVLGTWLRKLHVGDGIAEDDLAEIAAEAAAFAVDVAISDEELPPFADSDDQVEN
ncbi:MAG: hypothetical protein AAGF23_05310 [Acidobacteriota bacterium]